MNRKRMHTLLRSVAKRSSVLWVFILATALRAEDWPTWRHDAQRANSGKQQLAAKLYLHWSRDLPRQKTAWPDQPLLVFDRVCEPIVLGNTLFLGSARNDTLTALDTRTGAEKWTFHADGPIRFAPAGWENRVYFACDDGYLYCLDAETGKLLWKFRGGPSDRKILGNGRLISTWPARGAPVAADGTVYFAASIWPFMGIFIHALDAKTGQVVWTNDGDGSLYMKQPHNANSFAGVAPQGPLAVVGDKLLVPGGRSVPACYDRKTGKLIHFRLAENSKVGGGPDVTVLGPLVLNGGAVFDLESGKKLGLFCKQLAAAEDVVVGFDKGKLRAFDPAKSKLTVTEGHDRLGRPTRLSKWTMADLGSFEAPKVVESLMRVGFRVYLGSPGQIGAVELPLVKNAKPVISWKANVDGTPAALIAADDRLFAVTLEGRIYCFGPGKVEQAKTYPLKPPPAPKADQWTKSARNILDTTKARNGYCIAWGIGTGRIITELVRQSNLYVMAVDSDAQKVDALRRQMIATGLYGERVSVHVGDPRTFPLPPYLANLVVLENPPGADFVKQAFESLRPYGGVAWLPIPPAERGNFSRMVDKAGLPGCKLREVSDAVLLSREGALPDSANWTHEHADAANTRVSRDKRVKAPLGLLWFGGPSNLGMLPKHGHGPQPQVIDGRLIAEGVDLLRAVDIYTGRILWETKLPGLGKFYDPRGLPHQPGANATGTNYISTADGIYVVHNKACLRLDPATGRRLQEFRLPAVSGAKTAPAWGYVNVHDDYLIGGAYPLVLDPKIEARPLQLQIWDTAGQKRLFTLEGHTDQVTAVTFSPDGRLLATGSADKTVKLWHTATGRLAASFPGHTKRVTCVAFSPGGKLLATGGDDAAVMLWDVSARKPLGALKGHAEPVIHVAFSPDSKNLASGSMAGVLKLWDLATRTERATLEDLTDDLTCLAVSPDGKTVAAGSADATVKLWDVATGQMRAELARHLGDITCLTFSRDSKLLATGSKDKTVRLWDAVAGKHLGLLQGHAQYPTCIAFHPDGKMLAVGTRDASIRLWDLDKRESLGALLGQPGWANSVAFAPDGKSLAMGGMEAVRKLQNASLSASRRLVVMDRKTGKVQWAVDGEHGFRHNAICLGGGRLFCIDRLSGSELARMKRRGQSPKVPPRLRVFDLKTGEELWSTAADVFGTWLSYSAKHDVLLESGRVARDTLTDEPKGIRAYRADTGMVLWQSKTYAGPAMIHGDIVLKGQSACDILTGKPKMRTDPVTGQQVEWTWMRDYGCNTPAASECLLTFRSGAAGYFDLLHDGGTGNFGGFRSSCTNNLIVAGGLLNAPDYTRGCTCSYQNQCSLALVHMPEVETWTKFPVGRKALAALQNPFHRLFGSDTATPVTVKHLALALGAPGHRRAADGRFWLNEYDNVQVKRDPKFGYYRGHSSKIASAGGSLPWVIANGCRGIQQLVLTSKPLPAGTRYTVRLHFADPDNDRPGRRRFDVRLQDKLVLSELDIVKEAGGRHRGLVKEFKGVVIKDKLDVQFALPMGLEARAASVPLLCGIEVLREEE